MVRDRRSLGADGSKKFPFSDGGYSSSHRSSPAGAKCAPVNRPEGAEDRNQRPNLLTIGTSRPQWSQVRDSTRDMEGDCTSSLYGAAGKEPAPCVESSHE